MAWAKATMRTKTLNTWLCGCDSPYPTDLSPIHVVSEQFPPLMLVIATGDTLIEPSESYDLASKMKEAGGKVQYLEAVGMTHGLAEDGKETWPEGQNWWQEAILPSLTWVVEAVQQQQLTVYRVKVK
jgi:acetyl esterase/lipase